MATSAPNSTTIPARNSRENMTKRIPAPKSATPCAVRARREAGERTTSSVIRRPISVASKLCRRAELAAANTTPRPTKKLPQMRSPAR